MALGPNEPVTHAKLLEERIKLLEAGGENGGITPLIINAKGDIIVGSAADSPTILPVGSNGQVLSADSSAATGLRWITLSASGGGGAVTSVAGRTGDVTLTKSDVGLSNVNNTADADKPVSTAVQAALNGKADATVLSAHTSSTNNPHAVTKAQVGLSNVDNTADADKPVSIATQTALSAKADLVAGKVPLSQLPEISSGSGVQVWEWYVDTAAVGAGVMRKYNDSGEALTIVAVRVRANINAPTGSDLVIDVNKNGTTIFTNQANRPTIDAGTQDSGKVTTMDVTSLADGDYLVPDIDAIGSTVPGSGVLVSVTLR